MKAYPLKQKIRRAVRLARELYSLLNDLRTFLRYERPTSEATTLMSAAHEIVGAVYGMLLDAQTFLDATPKKKAGQK